MMAAMASHYFTVATFNARNLIRPGITYYGRNEYSQLEYDRKLDWMASQLLRMDADFVCLQEVFEAEPLFDLARPLRRATARHLLAPQGRARQH